LDTITESEVLQDYVKRRTTENKAINESAAEAIREQNSPNVPRVTAFEEGKIGSLDDMQPLFELLSESSSKDLVLQMGRRLIHDSVIAFPITNHISYKFWYLNQYK